MIRETIKFAVLLVCAVAVMGSDLYEPNVQTTVVKGVPGWASTPFPFISLGDKLYYFEHELKLNWHDASDACRRRNTQLVSIDDEAEKQLILEHLHSQKKTEQYWTSGNDLGVNRQFKWAGTGNPISYTFWGSTQPDNAGGIEHCVDLEMASFYGPGYFMNDAKCPNLYHFICEATGATTVAVTVW